ncbi:MAG: hypothetical protein IJ761_00530 [Bacteroidales bacterium]|nr:hypothetical protein [Bacteroidales bacterium]
MDKNSLISKLVQTSGCAENEASTIVSILEDSPFFLKNEQDTIAKEVAQRLGWDETRAAEVITEARNIIGDAIKQKIKHPFSN